jgi:hypothetical protein
MASLCQENDVCAMMIGRSGKVYGYVVHVERIALFQPRAATLPCADTPVASVKSHWRSGVVDDLVKRIEAGAEENATTPPDEHLRRKWNCGISNTL